MTFSNVRNPFRQVVGLTTLFALVGTCHGQAVTLVPSRQNVILVTLGFSSDGSKLAVAGNCVRVYDLKSSVWVHKADSSQMTREIAFSPVEADTFVTAGSDGVVRFWHVGEKRPFREQKGAASHLWGTAFSPDGKLLCTAGGDIENGKNARGEVALWHAGTGELIHKLSLPESGASCVNFSGDGKLVAFSKTPRNTETPSSVEIYDVSGWQKVADIPFSPGFASSLSFYPGARQLLATGGECVPLGEGSCRPTGRIWLIDADAMKSRELDVPEHEQRWYFGGAAVLPTGERFLTSTKGPSKDPPLIGESAMVAQFQMRDAETGQLIWSQEGSRQGTGTTATTVSRDGKRVAGCDNTMIVVFDAATGKLTHGIELSE